MKLVTFRPTSDSSPTPRVGLLMPEDEQTIDLQAVHLERYGRTDPLLSDMLAFLAGGPRARDVAEELAEYSRGGNAPRATHSGSNVQLLAPVPVPTSLRDCMCFEEHLLNAMRTVARWRFPPAAAIDSAARRLFRRGILNVPAVWHERPLYYKGNPYSVVGHNAPVQWPRFTNQLDFELEFGVFIGREGKDIPESRAAEHIAGYTIFNDFSARDIQLREMQGRLGPAKGKDFDTGNAIGPCLVTPDEVPAPYALTAEARINGDPWCHSSTAKMRFSFEEIIAYISRDETLRVGDFIGAGTLPGGCGLELDRWIQPGDEVELEVQGLGQLCNRVSSRQPG